jgi:hypothetical protein
MLYLSIKRVIEIIIILFSFKYSNKWFKLITKTCVFITPTKMKLGTEFQARSLYF